MSFFDVGRTRTWMCRWWYDDDRAALELLLRCGA
jgi:hypothetical protein